MSEDEVAAVEILDDFNVLDFDKEGASVVSSVKEALTGKSDWRGGTAPGRPKKGQETKARFADGRASSQVYDEVCEAAEADPMALFNAKDPSVPILSEKPEHRMMAYMRARGMSRKDIFEKLGGRFDPETRKPISGSGQYSYVHIGNILAQPWFRRIVIQLQAEAGMSGVEAAIQSELPGAIEVLTEIMYDKDVAANARLNAVSQILDRGLGKPIQTVKQEHSGSTEHVLRDAREIDRKMEMMQQELKQLGVNVAERR